jgi:hypothetical protein
MNVTVDRGSGPLRFLFSVPTGEAVKLLEVRVTEMGEEEPAWRLVHEAASLEDLVSSNLITAAEAEKAGVATLARLDGDVAKLVDEIGVPVSELEYGRVPPGLRQHGPLRSLKPNYLYQLLAVGRTETEFEFYA